MIQIILPYEEAARYYNIWAHEEKEIDFRKDQKRAARCTLSFAAEELCTYLTRLGLETQVTEGNFEHSITLTCSPGEGEGFSIEEKDGNITIRGEGRCGLLYGAYELLEAQGIRWYSPWEEFVPTQVEQLQVPKCGKYAPSMPLGRGFDFEGPLKESELLYLWMARNKLNLSAPRPNTNQFQRKLGMSFKAGGHIFEQILNPTQRVESGKTMVEEHPDWYGTGKAPLTAENALSVQFCMSNQELLEYLWGKLLHLLQTDWYEADRVDVWGFDTWGSKCQCEQCCKLGNGADQTLHFLSYLRERLDEAERSGQMDHPVRMVMCAYEGTATLQSPQNGVPKNLQTSGDYVTYYPILRCYEHEMADENCSYNSFYHKTLKEWQDIPIMLGEYYNVSKFEDLPLVFSDKIARDLPHYASIGIMGMTYMHLPMLEWGMRTLNQVLYAKLCWNADADVTEIKERYFKDLYGPFETTAQKAYQLTEEAVKHCSSWRAWCGKSILSGLLNWDGKKPQKELYRDDHLKGDAVTLGICSIQQLKQAKTLMRKIHKEADQLFAETVLFRPGIAVNPTDTRFKQPKNFVGDRIAQDIRGLQYGFDVYSLMVKFVEYYEALEQDLNPDTLWRSIAWLCHKMKEYCYSIKYQNPRPELNCVDALERSGLKDLYYRCLAEVHKFKKEKRNEK